MSEKSLLVIGGTGVISFGVVNEAIKQGYKVTCINRGRSKNQTLDKSVEVIVADYHKRDLVDAKLKNRHFDAVLDVLCFKPEDIEYSVSLLSKYCNQYIFFSSAESYNKPKYQDVIYDENVELGNSLWSYSVNKLLCEQKVIELSKKMGFKYTIVRPAITYGDTRIPYAIMPKYGFHGTVIQRLLQNKPILLIEEGSAIATFLRVEDFAVGFVGLIGNPQAYNEAFHISGDEYCSWKEIIDISAEILNVKPHYFSLNRDKIAHEMPALSEQIIGGRSISQRLDNSKIKKVVPNFKTTISIRDGVKSTIEYYTNHNYLSGIDWKFDADLDRIITKWCKGKGINADQYNLKFVDYLGNATFKDKFVYWLEYHKDNIIVKILYLGGRVVSKNIRK